MSAAAGPSIDVIRARALTPACERVLHFNNAGAALLPTPVVEAITRYRRLEVEEGGYEAAEMAATELEHARAAVANLLGAAPAEIAFTDSATRAWATAVQALRLEAGDRILTTRSEYASNFMVMLALSRRLGLQIDVAGDDEHGDVDLEALEALITSRTRLIALTHVPSTGGLVNPASRVGRIARAAGVPYLLDACQSAGQLPLDVAEIGCDLLAGTGRKYLRGPRGTGFLYVRSDFLESLEPATPDLHGAEWTSPDGYRLRAGAGRFELFEHDPAGRAGLAAAVDHALGWGWEAIEARVVALAAGLRERLAGIPKVRLRDRGRRLCGIVTFEVDEVAATDVRRRLRERRMNTWVSSVSSTRLDLEPRGITEMVRASVHYYNTEAEVDSFVAAVEEVSRTGGGSSAAGSARVDFGSRMRERA